MALATPRDPRRKNIMNTTLTTTFEIDGTIMATLRALGLSLIAMYVDKGRGTFEGTLAVYVCPSEPEDDRDRLQSYLDHIAEAHEPTSIDRFPGNWGKLYYDRRVPGGTARMWLYVVPDPHIAISLAKYEPTRNLRKGQEPDFRGVIIPDERLRRMAMEEEQFPPAEMFYFNKYGTGSTSRQDGMVIHYPDGVDLRINHPPRPKMTFERVAAAD